MQSKWYKNSQYINGLAEKNGDVWRATYTNRADTAFIREISVVQK